MVTEKVFKERWNRLSEKEKLDWNGFDGFCKNKRRKDLYL
jgi:hypothetical protein